MFNFTNSLDARESTLQRKGIKAKGANTNVTNAAKIDTGACLGAVQSYPMKQILQHSYHLCQSVSIQSIYFAISKHGRESCFENSENNLLTVNL